MIKYSVRHGSTGYCPPLHLGLKVHLTVCPEIEALECLRIEVLLTQVLEDGWYAGEVVYDFDEIRQGMAFRFKAHHVECVEGGIEYMKKYQRITVSRSILEGATPKVLRYAMMDDPWHCHRIVSRGVNEKDEPFEVIRVSEFLKRFPGFTDYLSHPQFTNFYWNGDVVGAFNFLEPR